MTLVDKSETKLSCLRQVIDETIFVNHNYDVWSWEEEIFQDKRNNIYIYIYIWYYGTSSKELNAKFKVKTKLMSS